MALEPTLIKPRDLAAAADVFSSDAMIVDDGVTVSRATPVQVVNAGAPVASEVEALAGAENTKRMTALRVAQAIADATFAFTLFEDVADLLASTLPAKGAGTIWQAGSFKYIEAASGATDHQVTTAGGVKLYVQRMADGRLSPMQWGATGNGVANDATAWQACINYAVPLSIDVVVDRNYQINSLITHPVGPATGAYSRNPTFQIVCTGNFTITTTLTGGNVLEVPGWGGAPGRQYHGFKIIGVNFRGPGTAAAAVSFIAPSNCRMPVIRGCTFAGSPGGIGIDVWASGSGGSFAGIIEYCHFGYQQVQTISLKNYRDTVTDLWPTTLLYGIRLRGPGNSAGKVNDYQTTRNVFYGCIGMGIVQGWHTAFSGDGGSGNLLSVGDIFVLSQSRDVEEDSAVTSATATTVTWPIPSVTVNPNSNTYTNFIAYIKSGTGSDQSRQITNDTVTAGVRTITVSPAWTVTPDNTSEINIIAATAALITEYGVGNIPNGHYFDHSYGWSCIGCYFEETRGGILGGPNADTDFSVVSPIFKVSNGHFITRTSGAPFGPRTGDDTGNGLWDYAPTNSVRTGITLRRSEGTGDDEEFGDVSWYTNGTGGDLVSGDVVRVGTSAPKTVVAVSAASQDRPKVVFDLSGKTFADGQPVPIALPGAQVNVKITGTVNENDTLVSDSALTGQVNNAVTNPKLIIGYALRPDNLGYVVVEVK